ncbi:MAG TPA: hypothetical protein VGC92_16265 [Phenylobacterium sp.]|jgi:DNA-directed RNA polymerase subunit RPC12/RpoP
MTIASRRRVLQGALFGAACACGVAHAAAAADAPSPTGKYICPPCGCDSDGQDFDKPGACPSCGMPLMAKPAEAPKPEAPKS